jgi:hypothetical protein
MLILVEFIVAAVLLLVALAYPWAGAHWFERMERRLAQLAQRRKLALVVVGFAAIGLRLAVLPIMPIPEPTVDDEFSYLLQADTFLHARLTNPTHPMWTHFETFHVNMTPTYQSKYPPAQGLVLAAGKLIGGHPIVGVWLSMAAMCAAICWMLQEWISPEWGLAGGLLLAVRLSAFSYWGNSYWGGAVAATGGALLLGGLVRIRNSPRTQDALLMGLGIAILATSRPYEGLVLCIPVATALIFWWLKKTGPEFLMAVRRVIVPLALCVAVTGIMLGYYNWRGTGHALLLPYQVNEATYSIAPVFIFQSPRPQPVYLHDALREFYLLFDLPIYQDTQSARGLLLSWYDRLKQVWLVLLGPLLTLPPVLFPFTEPRKLRLSQYDWRVRFLFWTSLVSIAGLAIEVYGLPHYVAPMLGVLIAIVLLTMRRMRRWKLRGRPAGLFLCRAIPLGLLLMLVLRAAAAPLQIDTGPVWPPTWYNSDTKRIPRTGYEQMLNALPGRHLVIVHYKAYGDTLTPHEWAYNAADIDSAKIVWAWDMGPAKNQELIDYFKDRKVWIVNLERTPPSEDSRDVAPAP